MIFRWREKEFWILIVSGLVLFHRPLFFGETFFFRDLHLHFFPQKLRFVELFRSGELPLWDPILHGGQPFLADLNNMALYPANWIYLLLPEVFAFNLDIIFHVLLCAAGAYWLARWLGISPLASIVAGAVYAFCGYSLSLTNLLSRLAAMAYLPLMILTILAFVKEKRSRWFAMCVLFGVLQVMAGAPEMTLISFLTLGGWLLFDDSPTPVRKRLAFVLLLAIFVCGIAAIQIVPSAEMVKQSTRSTGSGYDEFSAWSLHYKRLPEMIFPQFLGYTNRVSSKDYWGASLESMNFPFILSIYFGWLTLSLAFFGFALQNGSRRLRLFLGLLSVFALALSFGRHLPGFKTLFEVAPFLRIARYPIKFLAAALLPVSLLAAIGLEGIFTFERLKRSAAIYFWCSFLVFATLAAFLRFQPEVTNQFSQYYFGQTSATAFEGLMKSIQHTALISLSAAVLYSFRMIKRSFTSSFLMVCVILFDLIWSGLKINHYAPAEFLTEPPNLAAIVKKELGEGRFYRSLNPPNLRINLPANDVVYFNRWHMETLHNYTGAMYSIPLAYHEDFDNLAKKELVKLSDQLLRAKWNERLPILTAGAVTVFLTADKVEAPQVRFVATIRNSSSRPFYLYRNENVKELATLITRVETARTQEDLLKKLSAPAFDPANSLLLLDTDALSLAKTSNCERSVQTIKDRATQLTLRTKSDCDAYLYLAQPYYAGWKTTMDGNPVPSVQANYTFTAIFLPAGEHVVERHYRPASVKIGLVVTVACAFVLGIFLKRKRRDMA